MDNLNVMLNNLKKMIRCCQSIQTILEEDKTHIVQSDLQQIELNNKKKYELVESLNYFANNMIPSENFFKQIETEASRISASMKLEAQHIIRDFKLEVEKCIKFIAVNSLIVMKNLHQYKEIGNKLHSLTADGTCVYNEKGSIQK